MTNSNSMYTTQLQAGLGMLEETKLLLSIYQPGMDTTELYNEALASGQFPLVSARRLRNIIAECFAPRYLRTGSAALLKSLAESIPSSQLHQLLFVFTAEANSIFSNFLREVYWQSYSAGRSHLSLNDARDFVNQAVMDGKTQKLWSDTTIKRVSSYLIGCCVDFGLLSSSRGAEKRIQAPRIHHETLLFFAYRLHLDGHGDNAMLNHEIWTLFGLEPSDVRNELRRYSNNGWWIVQSAAEVVHITWQLSNMEEVINVIAQD